MAFRGRSPTPTPSACPTARDITEPGTTPLSASAYWQNIYNQRSEWAPCYYDATHVLSAYAIYQLPFGRGKQFGGNSSKVVDEAIGGWEIAPLVSVRTGWPMPVNGASDNSGTFGRGPRADCNSLPPITNTAVLDVGRQWFVNNGNFVQPATGTFGNCAPQLAGLRSPRYIDLDFSVHKNFQITERFRVQFRTDFVNALNHPQFNAPNMGLGSDDGTNYQRSTSKEYSSGLEDLLLTYQTPRIIADTGADCLRLYQLFS